MAEFKFQNNEIKDKNYRTLGRIEGKEIKDANYRIIARIDGDQIKDSNYRTIGRVQGQNVQDQNYRNIININDIKREIEGVDIIDPMYIAAIYFAFIKRGI